MGQVLEAIDVVTSNRVALKVLHPERRDDAEAIARMLREAEVATKLTSRHSGRLLDVCLTPSGEPILVMELLHGEDLAAALARTGSYSSPDAARMILEACEGIAEAHALGLVHRDIKPSNLFLALDIDGTAIVKVIDFGVVKVAAPQGETLTKTTSTIGSVAYMAPEQLRKLEVDVRSDVWSLGVVLYELVCGRHPFPADTITDASIRIAVEPAAPIDHTVDADLAAVIARCLEKDPAKRYRDVGELSRDLAACIDGADDRATRVAHTLGARVEPSPAVAKMDRSFGLRVRDAIATHWLSISIGVFMWSLLLLLGSFAADEHLNEFTIGPKRTGYLSSFNWTLVHTFFCPLTFAVIGILLRRARVIASEIGAGAAWDRRARNVVGLWLALCAIVGIGYTVVEWSYVFSGRCDRGTFLGWPNQLCAATSDLGSRVFMVLAAIAQAVMLCAGWLLLSIVIWFCETVFGAKGPKLDERMRLRLGEVFGIATWGWAALFVAMYIARLWSVHLREATTAGVIETVTNEFPRSLLFIDAHTQTDWGSMIAGTINLVAGIVPFLLLRTKVPMRNAAIALGIIGTISMIFPRLGFFVLPLGVIGVVLRAVRSRTKIEER